MSLWSMNEIWHIAKWRVQGPPVLDIDKAIDRLRPGDYVIDCGANIGEISERLSKSGATIYAFEPNPHAFAALQNRFVGQKNMHLYQQAIWIENSKMPLYLHSQANKDQVHYSVSSSLYASKDNVDKDSCVEVDTVDFSEFIFSLGRRIAFVKMDIEGAEFEVVKSLIETKAIHQIGTLVLEHHAGKIQEYQSKQFFCRLLAKERINNVFLNWR